MPTTDILLWVGSKIIYKEEMGWGGACITVLFSSSKTVIIRSGERPKTSLHIKKTNVL